MNLFRAVSPLVSVVQPPVPAVLRRSIGYVIGSGRQQVPQYAPGENVFIQVHALTEYTHGADLKQMDGLNVQGTSRAVFIDGHILTASRPDGTGGDLLEFNGGTWLVIRLLEPWGTWTRAAVTLQGGLG